jgi:NAD+ diphosphatase
MEMNYCMQCGAKLEMRDHKEEGVVPYCPQCGQYRWPVFNTAVSMIVRDEALSRILLIRQYGRPFYVLVAGYVNHGEDAEDAAAREVCEELGMTVTSAKFNHSHYFAPSNTLMLNFTVTVREAEPHPNSEVDDWAWFSPDEARQNIKPHSLAGAFLRGYLDGKYDFEA